MAAEWHSQIRGYIDRYWKPLATVVLSILSGIAGLERAGVLPTSVFGDAASIKPMAFLTCFLSLLIIIRFQRVEYWVHRVLFPRPRLPGNPPRIFRGPRSFSVADMGHLPGRQADIDA